MYPRSKPAWAEEPWLHVQVCGTAGRRRVHFRPSCRRDVEQAGSRAEFALSSAARDDYPITNTAGASYSHGVVIVPRATDGGAPSGPEAPVRPRVLVVDGQSLFVEALAGLLARPPLFASARTASGSDAALQLLVDAPADLMLCDLRVQPVALRAFLTAVRSLPQPPRVVLLGDVGDEDSLVSEIDTDVAALFTKDSEPEQFLEGVRAVLAGHRALGDNVMRRLIARLNGTETAGGRSGISQLSPTELDILAMVGGASSVEEIAQTRGISQKTVRNHLANIYRKLELRSRTEAMLCAARMGLTSN
jgi:DNA-binding NarL/FixJ family response regulator